MQCYNQFTVQQELWAHNAHDKIGWGYNLSEDNFSQGYYMPITSIQTVFISCYHNSIKHNVTTCQLILLLLYDYNWRDQCYHMSFWLVWDSVHLLMCTESHCPSLNLSWWYCRSLFYSNKQALKWLVIK